MPDPGGFQIDPQFLPSFSDTMAGSKKRNLFAAGLSSGVDELQSLLGSTTQLVGKGLGLPGVEQYGRDVAQRNALEATQNGRADLEVAPWKDGGAPVLPWLAYQATKQVPQLAGYITAGALVPEAAVPAGLARIGAVLPRVLGGGALRAGESFAVRRAALEAGKDVAKTAVGAEIAGIPLAAGSMMQEADQKPGGATMADVAKATILAPAYAALDALEPAQVKGLLSRGLEGKLARRVVTAGLVGAAAEVPQEGIQTAMEQSFRPDLSVQQKMTNIVDAAVTGGAVGGVFGGIGGLRPLKRADASTMSTDTLDAAIDAVIPPEFQLAKPTFVSDARGRTVPESDAETLRATPYEPSPTDATIADYGMPPSRPLRIESQTVIQPKQGSLRWAQPYDQSEPNRPFRDADIDELHNMVGVASNYLENLPEDHSLTERDVKVRNQLQLMTEELQARHILDSSSDIGSPAVEAVEPSATGRGATGGTQVAPVSASSWNDERESLLKGVYTRKHYVEATSVDDLTERTKTRLAAGSTAKSDLMLAERLGIDTNAPAAPVETETTRETGKAGEAAVEPEFQARWTALTKGAQDKSIRRMRPANEAEARRQVYEALAGPNRSEVGNRLEKLGQDLGLLDKTKQLTELGVNVSRETIPMQAAVKAATARGFKGAAASAFDRGARSPEVPVFDSFEDMAAFVAGREWSDPNVSTGRETNETVKKMGLGSNFEAGQAIPEAQQQQRWLNQAIDLKYSSTTHPAENAQLKQLVAQGAEARELDDAQRSFEAGRGILVNEPTERPTDRTRRETIFGPTVRPEPAVRSLTGDALQQFREDQAASQLGEEGRAREAAAAIRAHERKQTIRAELNKSLKLAADNQELAGGDYVRVKQAIDRNDFATAKTELKNIGGSPFMTIKGKVVTTGRDWLNFSDIAHSVLDSNGDPHAMMANLARLGGELGNMAKRFAKYVPDDVRVEIVMPDEMLEIVQQGSDIKLSPESSIQGLYDPFNKRIYISADAQHPGVFMHEMVHAIVDKHIDADTSIGREITRIFNRFQKLGSPDGYYDYAFTNPHEFMAEFLSRKQVRDYIRDYSRERNAGSLFARLWEMVRKALGMPARDYVERLLNLAEAAGATPVDMDMFQRTSPLIVNNAARERVENATAGAGRVVQQDGARGVARKLALGWATVHDIVEFWGKPWFGPEETNPVAQYEKALNAKQSIVARMAQMMTTARDEVQQLISTSRKSGETLVRLMRMSEFGIDPTKPWAQQSDRVRTHKNAANLEKLTTEAHKMYNDVLVRKGYAGIFQNLRNVNDVLMLSQLAVSLHAQVVADTWANKELPRFAVDPMDRFMAAQEKEDFNPARAREWWAGELQDQLGELDSFMQRYRNVAANFGDSTKELRQKAEIAQHTDPLATRAKNIRQTVQQMEEAPYFHLGRFGNYFVGWHVTDQDALGKVADYLADNGFGSVISRESDKVNVYMRLENQQQQGSLLAVVEELQAQGLIEPGTVVSGERTAETIRSSLADQWFNRMIEDIRADEDLSEDAKDHAIVSLQALHLDLMPENSLSRIMTHREGVPGYDGDMLRAFEHRANVGINALAGMVIAPKVSRAFTEMRKVEQSAQRAPSSQVSIAQRNGMTNVIDELSRRERERPTWPETKFLDQLRAGNHAFFLGFSISYGLVNLTQLGATLLPELAARHGFVNAATTIAKVTPIAFNIIREVAKQGLDVSVSRAMDAVVTRAALDKAGVKGAKAEFIMRVVNTGQIDIGGPSRELMRAAEGRGDGGIDQVLRYASSIGYYTETLSRLIAALAVRELNPKMDTAQVADHAAYVLKETMWDYSQANQGREFGKLGVFGKVTPLATAFMQYTAQLTGKLYRESYEAIKGRTPGERAEARRFLQYHLVAMTFLAGSLGLPMVSALAATVDRLKDLFDDDDEPSNVRAAWRNLLADTFGKDVGEILARGASRSVGLDISQRVGEQDILPFSRMIADRRSFKDSIKDMQARSWGAPSSMVANSLDGMEKIADGDLLGGMARMLPNALAAPVKAYRMTQKGYVDASGKELPMTAGGKDILVQLLGFNPAENAEYSESRGDQQVRKGQLTREATVLRNRLVQSVVDRDQSTARTALEQIQTFNRANPAFQIDGKEIEAALRRRARTTITAKASRTPLGTSLADRDAQALTRYANVEY